MGRYLTDTQIQAFRNDGFLVVPNFVSDERCLQLRERAMMLAEKYVPSPEEATVFTADGKPQHTSDDYFLTSGEQIRCFFEKVSNSLKGNPKLWYYMALTVIKLNKLIEEQMANKPKY